MSAGSSLAYRTYAALGLSNLARVAAYRFALRAGVHPVQRLRGEVVPGPFFGRRVDGVMGGLVAREDWRHQGTYFGVHTIPADNIPNWHVNYLTGAVANSTSPWFDISDFDPDLGDIKTVWEPSRWDWLLPMAQRAALGEEGDRVRLNAWLADWLRANPPYKGVNWKCGQEASIRVLHLALAAMMLGDVKGATPALLEIVRIHLARIAPTIGYAIGQQNNHGSSEAAALFVGGSWLLSAGDEAGKRWSELGRRWLGECAHRLIASDGTFSQYSLVYHRLMLDTYALAEVWRRHLQEPGFSAELMNRLASATHWLRQMVDPATGDGPNYGANDGAHIARLTNTGFRDFRPSLQWAAALFLQKRAVPEPGPWDQQLRWTGVEVPALPLEALHSITNKAGGMHILRQAKAVAYMTFPNFRFRPSQADALHVDLWIEGHNLLRDAGTYSYNSSDEDLSYFGGTAAHNTVQFDGRDQMPRLSRFLFGAWLKSRDVLPVTDVGECVMAGAAYQDHLGADHSRSVTLAPHSLVCVDRLTGDAQQAVLRWRLPQADWRWSEGKLFSERFCLSFDCDALGWEIELTEGFESRRYLEKTTSPVVEMRAAVPATLRTEVTF